MAATKPVVHNTFVIERRYAASPERVFAALSNPAKKRRWFAESETQEVELFEMDFKVGGSELMRSRFTPGTPFPGVLFVNSATYCDIVQDQRIVMSATMSIGEKRISVSLVTFELMPVQDGTHLVFTHQTAFLEGSDGPQMRENGWQTLLSRLEQSLTT